MDAFLENLQRAHKFLLILATLFRHQPTYKNLRGNTKLYIYIIITVAIEERKQQ